MLLAVADSDSGYTGKIKKHFDAVLLGNVTPVTPGWCHGIEEKDVGKVSSMLQCLDCLLSCQCYRLTSYD